MDPSSRESTAHEIACFAAGCFWGVQLRFDQTPGVLETTVGYMGGNVDHPTYEQVCTGTTGHAETVKVVFDPAEVSYAHLLDIFFQLHDPTQLNRQGPDVGTQYRSVIFTTTSEQYEQARQALACWAPRFSRPIVTQIVPAEGHTFWPAEDYHQKYLARRGLSSGCH